MPRPSRPILVDGVRYAGFADAAKRFKKIKLNAGALGASLRRGEKTYKGLSIGYAEEAEAVVDSWRPPKPPHKPGDPLLAPGHVTARTGIYQGLRV